MGNIACAAFPYTYPNQVRIPRPEVEIDSSNNHSRTGTEKPVFEITVTDWKGQGILKTNKKALEKYGYTLTETTNKYGNKLTLVWEEQSLSEEDKSNHYKDMEKCQMQKLIKIFIDNPLVSDIIVWEYGKITTNNKQELKNWGYSCNEWSRYDDDQLKLELVDDDQ